MKDHRGDEPKAKTSEPASTQDSEPSDKARRGRRRRQHKRESTTPATGVNKAEVTKKKDISEVKCYNCNKKGHFATKCPEPRKSKN